MDVDEAIRSRRTIKSFLDEPVDDETVRALLDLAVLAPNHHLTEPWRFWVVGRETLALLVAATGDGKLTRSATAIVVGVAVSEDAQEAEEDYAAVACALENVMLAARARGLASYWRTPGVFRRDEAARALAVPDGVRLVGILHLGWPVESFPTTPDRTAEQFTTWLP